MFRGVVPIEYESTLERDFLIGKEFLLNVIEVTPQPCTIYYSDGLTQRQRTYTPDFFVSYSLGRHQRKHELVEVKPKAEWRKHWRKWSPKWKAASRWAKDYNAEFRIYDESRIRNQALTNILFLDRYKRMAVPQQTSRRLLEYLASAGPLTIEGFLVRLPYIDSSANISHVWHLLASRRIDCEITQTLGIQTQVWVREPYA